MKKIVRCIGIFLSAFLVVSLYGCSNSQVSSSTSTAISSDSIQEDGDAGEEQGTTPQSAENETQHSETISGSYTIGETCMTANFAVELANASYESRVEDGNYLYYEPSSGNTFLILVFDIENTSSSKQTIQTVDDFSIYVDGYQVGQTSFGYSDLAVTIGGVSYKPLPSNLFDPVVTLEPGRKAIGYLVVEAPEDWSECEVEFDGATFVCIS